MLMIVSFYFFLIYGIRWASPVTLGTSTPIHPSSPPLTDTQPSLPQRANSTNSCCLPFHQYNLYLKKNCNYSDQLLGRVHPPVNGLHNGFGTLIAKGCIFVTGRQEDLTSSACVYTCDGHLSDNKISYLLLSDDAFDALHIMISYYPH